MVPFRASRRLLVVLLSAALVVVFALSASAHAFTKSSTYTGPNCKWTGTLGRETTSIYDLGWGRTQSSNCLNVQARLNHSNNQTTSYLTEADGDVTKSVALTTESNWSDHNVKFGGVWSGFRVNHG